MKQNQAFICYTDASYNNQSKNKIGVVYYMIYGSDKDHPLYEDHKAFENIKNSELEKIGIKLCVQKCQELNKNKHIIVYTDCLSALGNSQYPKNVVELRWVKGHSKKSQKDQTDLKFQLCDKKSRKIMRSLAEN